MATYYLNADTGNDSTGSGTSVAPWLTIAKALTAVATGDTIYLQNSTAHYTWATATIPTITIQGQSTTSVIVDAGGAGNYAPWTVTAGPTFNNITFTGNDGTGHSTGQQFLSNSSSAAVVTFNYCIFTAITIAGYGLVGQVNWTMNYCLLYNLTNVTGSQNVLSLGGSISHSESITLVGCTFYFNKTGSAQFGYVINGHIPSTYTLRSCIFVNVGDAMSAFTVLTTATTNASYCDFYGTGINGHVTLGAGCIAVDPLFIDPTNSNFNLQPTSPCIATGSL